MSTVTAGTKRIISILISALGLIAACEQRPPARGPEKLIAQKLSMQIDSFSAFSSDLQKAVEKDSVSLQQLQQLFLRAREGYKRIEWAAEYFDPVTARLMNGAPVQEVEANGQVFEPLGLQVIETYLYPAFDSIHRDRLVELLKKLQPACVVLTKHFANVDILDWQVFDAAKLEVFRVETVGITGFDDPLSLQCMKESAVALESVSAALANYPSEAFSVRARDAVEYLRQHADFNSFDRAEFILRHANPMSTAICDLQAAMKIKPLQYNRLLNQDARTLFDTNAFNVNAYMPDRGAFVTPEKVVLGQRLFNDPMLSGTGTRSCRSCHQPDKAFADGMIKNTVLGDHLLLARNTPTLINAALQPALFYDLRARSLEDQALSVVQNEKEMHGSMILSVGRLWRDSVYRRMFETAFVKEGRTGIDTLEVMNAIGSYVRSLTFLNSRFDEYMRGDGKAMTPDEVTGFNIFMGKAKCGSCHYMPLFNGTFPPRYMKIETEVIGVPQTVGGKNIDDDPGRYGIVRAESMKHAFKTPTIRNAARTAPYMHNGVFATLEQVIDFYNKGGGTGLGLPVRNQTLPFDKLGLTEKERGQLVDFIKSLDSRP
jgi:cytochrome c peroxidase